MRTTTKILLLLLGLLFCLAALTATAQLPDFRPSERVPAGEALSYPVDI